MNLNSNEILGAIAIGVGATLVMDLWNWFLKLMFDIPSLSYCLLGRWLCHMPGGTFRHASITAAPQKPLSALSAGLPTTQSVSRLRFCSSCLHLVAG